MRKNLGGKEMWKVVLIYLVILLGLIGITNATQIKSVKLIDGDRYVYVYDAENLILQFDKLEGNTADIVIFGKARWSNYLYISGNFKVKKLIVSFGKKFKDTEIYIMQMPSNIKDIGIIVPKNTKVINRTRKKIKILYY